MNYRWDTGGFHDKHKVWFHIAEGGCGFIIVNPYLYLSYTAEKLLNRGKDYA